MEAPLAKGQVVGTIDFQLNGKTIEQRPLVVMEAVGEAGFIGRMWDFVLLKLHQLFGGWFSDEVTDRAPADTVSTSA